MGRLYDAVSRIDTAIAREGMDPYKTRGLISMRTGFLLSLVKPEDPDDEQRLEALRAACRDVFEEPVEV